MMKPKIEKSNEPLVENANGHISHVGRYIFWVIKTKNNEEARRGTHAIADANHTNIEAFK
jgi:hypothetical protein